MPHIRHTKRERLEAAYLALAKEFSDVSQSYESRLLSLQTNLETIESPRLIGIETQPRKDALELLPHHLEPTSDDNNKYINTSPEDEYDNNHDAFRDPTMSAARSLTICKNTLKLITKRMTKHELENPNTITANTKEMCSDIILRVLVHARPRLYAEASLIALDDNPKSMRQIAKEMDVSPEWVSQLCEQVRSRYGIPKNQHNKSDEARAKYRELRLGKTRKAS